MTKNTTATTYKGVSSLALDAATYALQGNSRNELDSLAGMIANTNLLLAQAVRAAREDGISWAEIGGTLGMSKQAAQQRFGR